MNFKKTLCGFIIGISIIIPGISGSMVAISLNLYNDLIYYFSNLFKFKSIKYLFTFFIGLILGLLFGLVFVKILVNNNPFIMTCYFTGLMIGSIPSIYKKNKKSKLSFRNIILFLICLFIPILISLLSHINYYKVDIINSYNIHIYVYLFFIGLVVSLTQIIPGLSATFFLMITGLYSFLINNLSINILKNNEILFVYFALFFGFIIGIILFSKIINIALEKYNDLFNFIILGLSIGSIISIYLGKDCFVIYNDIIENKMYFKFLLGFLFLILGFFNYFMLYLSIVNKREVQ